MIDEYAAWNEALAASNDPEYVALALSEGVDKGVAAAVAMALQHLRAGRHDEADVLARNAERLLAVEYMEAKREGR